MGNLPTHEEGKDTEQFSFISGYFSWILGISAKYLWLAEHVLDDK
jgi:hypothetical protein